MVTVSLKRATEILPTSTNTEPINFYKPKPEP